MSLKEVLGFSDAFGRNGRIDHRDLGPARYARDRYDIVDEVEVELIVERRIDRD